MKKKCILSLLVLSVCVCSYAKPAGESRHDKLFRLLAKAVNTRQLDNVRGLFNFNPDFTLKDKYSDTGILIEAIHHNYDIGIVKLLLDHGINVNYKDELGGTALVWAARHRRSPEIIRLLVERGAQLNIKAENGLSLMPEILKSGNLELTRYLLEKGAELKPGCLTDAITSGNLELIKFMVEEKQMDLYESHSFFFSPLAAAFATDLEIAQYLISQGADCNRICKDGSTLLMECARSGSLDSVKYLVETLKTDINAKNRDGMNALLFALEGKHPKVINYLLDHGADLNQKLRDGSTLLAAAARLGDVSVLTWLLDKGMDVNSRNKKGLTALMLASSNGHLDAVKFLLSRKSDVNACDERGYSALMYAAKYGHLDMMRLLLANNADTDMKTKNGDTLFTIGLPGKVKEYVCTFEY